MSEERGRLSGSIYQGLILYTIALGICLPLASLTRGVLGFETTPEESLIGILTSLTGSPTTFSPRIITFARPLFGVSAMGLVAYVTMMVAPTVQGWFTDPMAAKKREARLLQMQAQMLAAEAAKVPGPVRVCYF